MEGAKPLAVVAVVIAVDADVARGADNAGRIDLNDTACQIRVGRCEGDVPAEAERPPPSA